MATAVLTSFGHELLGAWQLFRERWGTTIPLALLPLVPLLFTLPYVIERAQLAAVGEPATPSATTTGIAILALLAFYIATVPARAAIFITYARRERLGLRAAVHAGLKRFWPFFFTEILVLLLVAVSFLPLLGVYAWYTTTARLAITDLANRSIADTTILLTILLLSIPPVALSILFAFAPLAVATRDTPGGLTALGESAALIRQRQAFWAVLGRLALWVVLFVVICTAVHPLPFAGWLTPFFMSLIGAALLIVIYKELRAR